MWIKGPVPSGAHLFPILMFRFRPNKNLSITVADDAQRI